jgi:hypothetical protein
MKFKLIFDETEDRLKFNIFITQYTGMSNSEICDRTNFHVHYQMPSALNLVTQAELNSLITEKNQEQITSIVKEIQELQHKKTLLINNLRADINPKAIAACDKIKMDYAEYFV